MKKIIFLFPALLMACLLIPPTPNDFPPPPPTLRIMPPPVTVIVEFPNVTATPMTELRPRLVLQSDMSDAQTFLLILKIKVASGDDYGFAENVYYPIQIELQGRMKIIATRDEFVENFTLIMNDKIVNALSMENENSLIILSEGIRVGNGEVWLNLFCVDSACTDTQFFITQINN